MSIVLLTNLPKKTEDYTTRMTNSNGFKKCPIPARYAGEECQTRCEVPPSPHCAELVMTYLYPFLQVTEWQATLGEVETVLKLLLTVQRQWTSLEAIFLTSMDIRAQLPDDTRRYANFKN